MVNEWRNLDELILQVFEEHEDQFFFPLTSQKTARTFVKAMHAKGFTYDDMCKEIEEFEHNFSAWRKGLGRVGIGKRVLQRINEPMQQLLESDDEDLYNSIQHMNGKHPPSSTQNGSNCSRLHSTSSTHSNTEYEHDSKADVQSQPNNQTDTHSKSHVVKQTRSHSESKTSQEDDPPDDKNQQNVPSIEITKEDLKPVLSKKEETVQEIVKHKHKEEEHIRAEKSQMADIKVDAVEMREHDKNEEEQEDESKRRSVKDLIAEQEKKTDSAPASPKLSRTESASPKLTRTDSKDETREERLARLQEKIAQLKKKFPKSDDVVAKDETPKAEKENKEDVKTTTTTTTNAAAVVVSNTDEKSPVVSPSSSRSDSPIVTKSTSESRSDSDSDSESVSEDSESPEVVLCTNDKEEEEAEDETKDDEEEAEDETKDDEEEAEDETKEDQEEMQDEEVMLITESYDSDFDVESNTTNDELQQLVKRIQHFKRAQTDGAGYVYVLTDSAPEAIEQRMKIGASRYPTSRLEQAQLFNPDVALASSIPVRLRLAAVRHVAEMMEPYLVNGTESWYSGDAEHMLDIVMKATEQFAEDASQC